MDGHVGAPAAGERRGLEEALGEWNGGPIANFAAFVSGKKKGEKMEPSRSRFSTRIVSTPWAQSQTPFPVSTLKRLDVFPVEVGSRVYHGELL